MIESSVADIARSCLRNADTAWASVFSSTGIPAHTSASSVSYYTSFPARLARLTSTSNCLAVTSTLEEPHQHSRARTSTVNRPNRIRYTGSSDDFMTIQEFWTDWDGEL